ncbi:hypothetical protein HDK77DRAFT_500426 [Phyllosticta capitalensis]
MSLNSNNVLSTKPSFSFSTKTHIDSLKEFCGDVQGAIDKALPTGSYVPFSNVTVLGMTWSNDDLGCKKYEDMLLKVFRDIYHFKTQSLVIPAQDFSPGQVVRDTVNEMFKGAKADELFIIIYSGHSWMNEERLFWFGAKARDLPLQAAKPWIHWKDIEGHMTHLRARVLHIFDTCVAANASLHEGPEFLGASGFHDIASSADRNFITVLCDVLKKAAGNPRTVAQLHGDMMRKNEKTRLLGATPVHLLDDNKPSIVLHKVPGPSLPGEARASSLKEINNSVARVLISVNLSGEMSIPDRSEWQKWLLSDLPKDLQSLSIRVESIHNSNSLLVIVSMPVEIWDCLPAKKRAYNFISFVYQDQGDTERSGGSQPYPFKERKENIPIRSRGDSSGGRK